MLTLINDDFSYSDLLANDFRKTKFSLDYFKNEYDENEFKKQFETCLGEENYLCDLSLIDYAQNYSNLKNILDKFQNIEIIKDFNGFNAAIYQGFCVKDFLNIISKTKAKIIDFDNAKFENGARFLEFDKDLAFKQAAKIMLDAYDSGADFILVGDNLSFKMFDTYSNELMRVSNRDFEDFYVLHFAEFIALANNKIPKTLKNHKLKVSLI